MRIKILSFSLLFMFWKCFSLTPAFANVKDLQVKQVPNDTETFFGLSQ